MQIRLEEFTVRLINNVYTEKELLDIFNNNNNYYVKSIVANRLGLNFDYSNGEKYEPILNDKNEIVVEVITKEVDVLKEETELDLINQLKEVINDETKVLKIKEDYLDKAYKLYNIDINSSELTNEDLMEIEEINKVFFRAVNSF